LWWPARGCGRLLLFRRHFYQILIIQTCFEWRRLSEKEMNYKNIDKRDISCHQIIQIEVDIKSFNQNFKHIWNNYYLNKLFNLMIIYILNIYFKQNFFVKFRIFWY
jgi:hypothetical protein